MSNAVTRFYEDTDAMILRVIVLYTDYFVWCTVQSGFARNVVQYNTVAIKLYIEGSA